MTKKFHKIVSTISKIIYPLMVILLLWIVNDQNTTISKQRDDLSTCINSDIVQEYNPERITPDNKFEMHNDISKSPLRKYRI